MEADLPQLRETFVALAKLELNAVAKERRLYWIKWFDYRFISPLRATELFVKEYQSSYRHFYEKYFSAVGAPAKSGTRKHDWKSSKREFSSFWVARQFADELGLPYVKLMEYAFQLASRRGWERLPRPNQLYGGSFGAALASYATSEWQKWTSEAALEFSKLPEYQTGNFRRLSAQRAHEDWVVKQLGLRHGDHEKLAHLCYRFAVLSPERARAEFGEVQFGRARQFAERMALKPIAGLPTPTPGQPSCFGLNDNASIDCAICGAQSQCATAAAFLNKHLISKYGSTDPRAAERRRQQRERTRKHRARAKTLSTSGACSTHTEIVSSPGGR